MSMEVFSLQDVRKFWNRWWYYYTITYVLNAPDMNTKSDSEGIFYVLCIIQ